MPSDFEILFPMPENRRNADDMGMPSPIKSDPACSGCAGITHTHTCGDPAKQPQVQHS